MTQNEFTLHEELLFYLNKNKELEKQKTLLQESAQLHDNCHEHYNIKENEQPQKVQKLKLLLAVANDVKEDDFDKLKI